MQRSLSSPAQNAIRPVNRSLSQTPVFQRRRSNSTSNCIIEKKRGFRPSDRFDPVKRQFLVELGKKFWCRPPVRNLCPLSNKTIKKLHNIHSTYILKSKKKTTHQNSVTLLYKHSEKPLTFYLYLAHEKWYHTATLQIRFSFIKGYNRFK